MSDLGAKNHLNLTVHGIQLKLRTGSKIFSAFSSIYDSRIMNESLALFTRSRKTDCASGKLQHNVKELRIFRGIGSRPFSRPSIWEKQI